MDQQRLAQEYAALNPAFDPQRSLIQQQITQLPQQYEGQKTALEQAKQNAFRDISSAAQARGTFFSGFRPEQMGRYTGEKFLPALANLSTQQQQATFNLQKALADIDLAQRQGAMTNLQNILNREQQQRQYEQSLAASRASAAAGAASAGPDLSALFGGLFGGGGDMGAGEAAGAAAGQQVSNAWKMVPTGKSGVNFFNAAGKPVSALQYAQAIGRGGNFGAFLKELASAGDANAKIAAQYAGNNFKNVPIQYKGALQALGIGSATYVNPAKQGQFTPAIKGIGSFR